MEFWNPDLLEIRDVDIWNGTGEIDYAHRIRTTVNPRKEQQKYNSYGWMFIILATALLALAGYLLYKKYK